MGGKIVTSIFGLPEKRIPNNEYLVFKDKIVLELTELFPKTCKIGYAPAIKNKESHGDLDLIVGVNGYFDSTKLLKEKYNVKPHINTNVTSLPIDGFQVDITFVPMKDLESSINYSSYGDCSNLIGRIAHKMGLHHSHIGLSFWIRQSLFDQELNFLDNDTIMEKLVLSKDYSIVLPLLGFDYNKWKEGFDTNEGMYHFIVSSKYFNREIFALENLNSINRIRNKKRQMYAGFLEWLKDNAWKYNSYSFQRREYYIPIWAEHFPVIRESIQKNKKIYELNKKFKDKVNGHKVMELLNITDGKEVGRVMGELKKLHTKEEWIKLDQEEIDRIIISFKN